MLRNSRLSRCLLITVALFFGTTSVFAASLVSKINIVGNRRIEPDAILEKMSIKPGSELSPESARADILKIFALGHFEDVRFEMEGDALIVSVKERPVITEIEYEGSEEFEMKDLDEASGIKEFTVVNLKKISTAKTAIKSKYEQKGYYLARVEHELIPQPDKPGDVKLVFRVDEREKVQIRKILFRGNKNFTSAELRRFMATGENHMFSWASGGGTYRGELFERDLGALAYFYGNEGYIEAKFNKPRVTLSQDKHYVDLFIDVEEGKKFFLGSVKFKGDDLFTEKELRDSFAMQEGDVFSIGKLQEEILKLTDKFGDQGYAFANVVPRTLIRQGTTIVDLDVEIEKGEKVYWNRISVTGNSKTHDKVVRRELPFNEGDLYNATLRKKGMEKIKRLGFFGEDINFLTSTPPGQNNKLDLEVKVEEKPTGSLNVMAGWGSGVGFSLGAQIAQNNLMGRGQQLSFNLSLQKTSQTFNLSFTDPRVFDSAWLLGGDLYIDEQQPIIYKRRLSGSSIRTGKEIRENLNLLWTYKVEHSLLSNPVNPEIFSSPKDWESYISSITTTLSYDTRNNRLDPSSGRLVTGSLELAGLGFGRVFQKSVFNYRQYQRVFSDVVYRFNFDVGLLTDVISNETVPDTERFILGGIFSLRGYPYYGVGPVRVMSNLRDGGKGPEPFVIGGTRKLVINQEFEFPLIPDAGIRGALFFDMGNAWDEFSRLSPVLLSNYGWGIRWYSPLGPLRFEFGYPINLLHGENHGMQFQFIIAPTF